MDDDQKSFLISIFYQLCTDKNFLVVTVKEIIDSWKGIVEGRGRGKPWVLWWFCCWKDHKVNQFAVSVNNNGSLGRLVFAVPMRLCVWKTTALRIKNIFLERVLAPCLWALSFSRMEGHCLPTANCSSFCQRFAIAVHCWGYLGSFAKAWTSVLWMIESVTVVFCR